MKNACIQEEELPVVLALPESDARRRHLEGCARCRARLAAFNAFLELADAAEGARPDEADRVLASILDREIFGAASRAAAGRRLGGSSGAGFGAMIRLLWRPALRPVWAVGILLLGIVGVRELRQSGDEPIILREDRDAPAASIVPGEPAWTADGRLELRWGVLAGADRYLVLYYGVELDELGQIDAGATPRCLLPEAAVRQLREGTQLFYRIFALRGGDRIASSAMTPLRLPRAR